VELAHPPQGVAKAAPLPTVGSWGMVANMLGVHNTMVCGQGNQGFSSVTAGSDVLLGDMFSGDKVGRDKIVNHQPPAGSGPAAAPPPGGPATRISQQAPPWWVFLAHTPELHQYPASGSHIDRAERAVSAAKNLIVDMAAFPSIEQTPRAPILRLGWEPPRQHRGGACGCSIRARPRPLQHQREGLHCS
jgi:hypothetical protein